MTLADRISREIDRAADDVFRIRPLARTHPHVFCEDKQAVAQRLRALAAEVRNTFGGPAGQFEAGTIAGRRGRLVRVEIRRKAA